MNHNTSDVRPVSRLVGVVFFVSLLGGNFFLPSAASGGWVFIKESPVVTISPNPAPFDAKKATILIAGAGFEPKQQVRLLIVTEGGLTGITYLVKPEPIANESGAFASEWRPGRMLRTLKPTAYTLRVLDEDGNVLAQAPIVFSGPAKPKEKKKKEKK